MITGGWEFVWAAYGISWGGLALYALSLMRRHREALRVQADVETVL